MPIRPNDKMRSRYFFVTKKILEDRSKISIRDFKKGDRLMCPYTGDRMTLVSKIKYDVEVKRNRLKKREVSRAKPHYYLVVKYDRNKDGSCDLVCMWDVIKLKNIDMEKEPDVA